MLFNLPIVTLVLSMGSIDEADGVVGIDLRSCRLDGAGGEGKFVLMDDVGDGAGDCCLPGVFNISIRLLSIKCSLKESIL